MTANEIESMLDSQEEGTVLVVRSGPVFIKKASNATNWNWQTSETDDTVKSVDLALYLFLRQGEWWLY